MLTCDNNQLLCTFPNGQQWLVANSRALTSISVKKGYCLFMYFRSRTKQTSIYGTYLSAWQFFVSGQTLISSPPGKPVVTCDMKVVHTLVKWPPEEIFIVLFILIASCKTSWGRAWYSLSMEMTVPPLVLKVYFEHQPAWTKHREGKVQSKLSTETKDCRTGEMITLFISMSFTVGLRRTSRYLTIHLSL